MSRKVALITGVTGQDGSYLTALLLAKGYEVHGLRRRASLHNTGRVDRFYHPSHEHQKHQSNFFLHFGDVTDAGNLVQIMKETRPDEIYNLAAQSQVDVSFQIPEYTANVNAIGPLRILEAIRISGLEGQTKFYQASTSEMFGNATQFPQSETTPFAPRSPYAAAKLYAHWITVNYREAYGIFACNGILFNHESPLRGDDFVTRKITRAVAAISVGRQSRLYLGNLEARRDWGHARDYVEGMWRILQHPTPEDWVLATGATHSVRDFTTQAFAEIDIRLEWQGSGIHETGIDAATGNVLVVVDSNYFRPTETENLCGDASKARNRLNWAPTADLRQLINEMIAADLAEARMHAP